MSVILSDVLSEVRDVSATVDSLSNLTLSLVDSDASLRALVQALTLRVESLEERELVRAEERQQEILRLSNLLQEKIDSIESRLEERASHNQSLLKHLEKQVRDLELELLQWKEKLKALDQKKDAAIVEAVCREKTESLRSEIAKWRNFTLQGLKDHSLAANETSRNVDLLRKQLFRMDQSNQERTQKQQRRNDGHQRDRRSRGVLKTKKKELESEEEEHSGKENVCGQPLSDVSLSSSFEQLFNLN